MISVSVVSIVVSAGQPTCNVNVVPRLAQSTKLTTEKHDPRKYARAGVCVREREMEREGARAIGREA